jgi:hypothetical protein
MGVWRGYECAGVGVGVGVLKLNNHDRKVQLQIGQHELHYYVPQHDVRANFYSRPLHVTLLECL